MSRYIITDETVIDPATGLEWTRATIAQRVHAEAADRAVSDCRAGGHSDWRLPTIAELLTLVDYSRYSPAIDADAFPDTKADWYWSSSSYAADAACAWAVAFDPGSSFVRHSAGSACVRAVRNRGEG